VSPAKGPTTIYRDHLPLLGQHYHRSELKKHGANQRLILQDNQLLQLGDRVRESFHIFFLNNENIDKLNNGLY